MTRAKAKALLKRTGYADGGSLTDQATREKNEKMALEYLGKGADFPGRPRSASQEMDMIKGALPSSGSSQRGSNYDSMPYLGGDDSGKTKRGGRTKK